MKILDTKEELYGQIISWNHDGKSFTIHDRKALLKYVLPEIYENYTFFSTFLRQVSQSAILNSYFESTTYGGWKRVLNNCRRVLNNCCVVFIQSHILITMSSQPHSFIVGDLQECQKVLTMIGFIMRYAQRTMKYIIAAEVSYSRTCTAIMIWDSNNRDLHHLFSSFSWEEILSYARQWHLY